MNNFNFDLDNSVDEDFFGSLKGNKSSKLQQLFGEDALSADDKQQSLKYQRPKANDLKANDNKDVANTASASSTTLLAKVVMAYRRGELQGKVGMALIQSPDNTYNIIMYKTKAHILATLKLIPNRDLLYKQRKFWQFYDEESIYWSFSFETPTDEDQFIEKLKDKSLGIKEILEEEKSFNEPLDLPKSNDETQNLQFEEDFPKQLPTNNNKETKTSLIKRMAKMGKPLPTLASSNQQTTTDFSDSSDTEVIKTPLATTQKPSIAPRSNKLATIKATQQLVPSMVNFNSPASSTAAVYPINALESQYMQMLLTEQRTQGSELRMNMNKLENKIEKVLDKLELCDRTDGKSKPEKDDEILEMEEKLLMLKKENRKLKLNLQELSAKGTEDTKIRDLIYEFKEDWQNFEIDYKQDVKSILKQLHNKLEKSTKSCQETQQKLQDKELKLEKLNKDLVLKSSDNMDLQKKLDSLEEKTLDLKRKIDEQDSTILTQKQKLLDIQKQLQEKNQELSEKPSYDNLVKSIMNNLYVDIADKLDNSNLTQSERILTLIAASIKQQTLKSLQQSKDKK